MVKGRTLAEWMENLDKLKVEAQGGYEEDRRLLARNLAEDDLFYMLTHVLGRRDALHPWVFEQGREIQRDNDNYMNLWARGHYKSTYAFAEQMQHAAKYPEDTQAIFSFTRPIAKAFQRQIKTECEENIRLHYLWPEVFWEDPRRESPVWSLDTGLLLKRESNPNAATFEAWGLVDGQPTSKHYHYKRYDDIVSRESVTNPEQIAKTTRGLEDSFNLESHDHCIRKYYGTRWHYNDTYRDMMQRGAVTPRIRPATDDGTANGTPVLLTREELQEKRRDMGPYVFSAQMLMDPKEDAVQGFKLDWIQRFHAISVASLNIYIVVDPASSKKKDSDYTAMWVIGLGPDRNYYLLDGVWDRLNLTEKGNTLFRLQQKWQPIRVGYEKYGLQTDREHYEYRMRETRRYFTIVDLGGSKSKYDRIQRLVPVFEQRRMWFPEVGIPIRNYKGDEMDLVAEFLKNEYEDYPYPLHDDMLDAMARILDSDLAATFPKADPRSVMGLPAWNLKQYGRDRGKRRITD